MSKPVLPTTTEPAVEPYVYCSWDRGVYHVYALDADGENLIPEEEYEYHDRATRAVARTLAERSAARHARALGCSWGSSGE